MYLFLIYLIIVLLSTNCNGQRDKPCSVYPKDQFIEEGSDAEITCQSACVSGKVFWKLNKKNVNESLSHKINSTHTVLKLPHSELQDPSHPTATVECHSVENDQILGGTTIRTYTKPHNLTCIMHSNKQSKLSLPRLFTCNWKHQINSQLKINYSVICVHCRSDQRVICSTDVTNCTRNTLDIFSQISFVQNNTVYVTAKTDFWEAGSSKYTFKTSDIFKIPPRKVNVSALSEKILVEWDNLPKAGVNGHCQVKYKYTKNKEVIKHMLSKTLTPYEDGRLTTDEVESCRQYSVYVRCALDRAPWSYWSPEKTVVTKLKKKDVKLDVWRKVSAEIEGERKVHVMWKGIPPECPGTFSYTVKHAPYKQLTSETAYTETLCGNNTCDISINREAHSINLTVVHNDALLAEDSFNLPAVMESDSNGLPEVKGIEIKHEKSGLVVHWKAPSQPISGYMIDWTHDGYTFDWKKIQFTNTTLYGLVDKTPYNITVTLLFNNKIGHSTQISGICYSFAGPGNVTILNVKAYDKSAHVSWSIKSQEKCSDVAVNYTVFYGTQTGPQFNVTVNNRIQDIYLKNLNPDTQYSVHVVATAQTGNVRSNERLFKTKRYDPQLITVLSISGSVIIILILSLGLCCAIVWRKFNEKPVPNPGLSSLALWPQTTCQKRVFPFEQFNTPSESLCEEVYTEEMQQTSVTIYCNLKFISDHKEVNAVSPQNADEPSLPTRKPHQPCSSESSSMMTTDNSQYNPYRSQTSAESPVARTSKKRFPPRQQERERTPAYISLDMFDQED